MAKRNINEINKLKTVIEDIRRNTLQRLFATIKTLESGYSELIKSNRYYKETKVLSDKIREAYGNFVPDSPEGIDKSISSAEESFVVINKLYSKMMSLKLIGVLPGVKAYTFKVLYEKLIKLMSYICPKLEKPMGTIRSSVMNESIPYTAGLLIFIYGIIKRFYTISIQKKKAQKDVLLYESRLRHLKKSSIDKNLVDQIEAELKLLRDRVQNLDENEDLLIDDVNRGIRSMKARKAFNNNNQEVGLDEER